MNVCVHCESVWKMKLVVSSLLLASLCALSSRSVSSETLHVEQSPDVSVHVGETVNITCCWKSEGRQLRVVWEKNQIEINDGINLMISTNDSRKKAINCSTQRIEKVTKEDSGRYVCEVTMEIPYYNLGKGNGTIVTVTTKEDKRKGSPGDIQRLVVIVLGVLVPLLFIGLVSYCSLKHKQAQATRVIYEVPHIDSEVDKQSISSSTASAQWCQVPLYESCDYFERVETANEDVDPQRAPPSM